MIFIIPMLTSGSVSPNVVPGLMKAVEKYAIIYGLDDILRAANSVIGKTVETTGKAITVASGGKLRIEEGEDLTEQGTKGGVKTGKQKEPENLAQQISQAVGQTLSGKGGKEEVRIDNPSYNALSLEPTWIQVATKRKGLQILGVKAIPFPVQSSSGLSSLLLNDSATKTSDYLTRKYSRMMIRLLFRVARKFHIPILKDRVLTGNPQNDILWASTVYKRNLMVVLNQMELENNELFSSPKTIQRLHKLGWSSFIIADDVNKRATFCMKEFGGVCSTVLYNYLFASLGKEHSKVYEDTEEARRAASPIFRMSTNKKRVFGDSLAYNKLNQYRDLDVALQEDLKSIASEMKISDIAKRVKDIGVAITDEDEGKLKNSIKGIPKVTIEKVEEYGRGLSDKFNSNYKFAQKVIENSTNFSPKVTKASALLLSIGSTLEGKGQAKPLLKTNLKNFVTSTRSNIAGGSEILNGAKILLTALGTLLLKSKYKTFFQGGAAGIKLIWQGITSLIKSNKTLVVVICIVLFLLFVVWISQDA